MARRSGGGLGGLIRWLFTPEKPTRKRKPESVRIREATSKAKKIARAEPERRDEAADLAERLERGEIRGDALRDLMASGKLNRRRNPSAPKALQRAKESSERFHGTDKEVVELSAAERAKLPKYAPVYGRITAIEIEPRKDSARGDSVWRHVFSDRGPFSPKNVRAALLVWDPRNPKRMAIVQEDNTPGNGPDLQMDENRGIVG